MTHYAWTIKARGRDDIRRVTTLAEMQDVLRILSMPGRAPPDWIIAGAENNEIAGHGRYTHNEGGKDAWTLIWTKLDDSPKRKGLAHLK